MTLREKSHAYADKILTYKDASETIFEHTRMRRTYEAAYRAAVEDAAKVCSAEEFMSSAWAVTEIRKLVAE